MKNILLCGATGFIGRNLLEYFDSKVNYKVRAIYHNKPAVEGYNNVEWCQADLNSPQDVDRVMQGIDVVLQFAATTSGAKDITTKPHCNVSTKRTGS